MPVQIPEIRKGRRFGPDVLKDDFGELHYEGAEEDFNKGLIRSEEDLRALKAFRVENPKKDISRGEFDRWKESGHTSRTLSFLEKQGLIPSKETLKKAGEVLTGKEAEYFRLPEDVLPSRFIEPSALEQQLMPLMQQLAPQFAQQAMSRQIPQIPFASQLAAGPMMQQPTQMNFGDLMQQLGAEAAPILQQYLQSERGQEMIGSGLQRGRELGSQALGGLGSAGGALMGAAQRGATGLSGLLSGLLGR